LANLKILLVEDDLAMTAVIADILRSDGNSVEACDRGIDGLRAAAIGVYDVVVLDRMLPDLGGLEIIGRLRSAGIVTPILMLSALARSEDRTAGLREGADDYLAKPFEREELLARVHALHRRAVNAAPSAVMIYGDIELHLRARTAYRQGTHVPLGPKEFEILKFFMENAGNLVTREMLLTSVWKLSFDPQTNVVDVNIGRLRAKLESNFNSIVIDTIRGVGFILTLPQLKEPW
jgi:two-component system OmpR family response regulator